MVLFTVTGARSPVIVNVYNNRSVYTNGCYTASSGSTLFDYGNTISCHTLVDLASDFFVLCINMKVYLYNCSWWVEPCMNIHGGKG